MKYKLFLTAIAFVCGLVVQAQSTATGYFYGDGVVKEIPIDTSSLLVYFNKAEITREEVNSRYIIEKEVVLNSQKADSLFAFRIGLSGMTYNQAVENLKSKDYVFDIEPIVGRDFSVMVSNRFFVRLKLLGDTAVLKSLAEQTMASYDGAIIEEDTCGFLWYGLSTSKTTYNALEMSIIYGESGLFEAIDPGFIYSVRQNIEVPSDTMIYDQWSVYDCFDLWYDTILGYGVKIAVIDDGIDLYHNEFSGLSVVSSVDYTSGNMRFPAELNGSHGTEVAGVIFANHSSHNIAGIAPHASLINISTVQDPITSQYYEDVIQNISESIIFAKAADADVILCPFDLLIDDGPVAYNPMFNSIDMAYTLGRQGKGTIVVFSSGNDYDNPSHIPYPAKIDDRIVVVGASKQSHYRIEESCYGNELDVVAPGMDILTTMTDLNGHYGLVSASGTSVAAAHVAGVVALMLSVNPDLTYSQVDWILKHTAYKSPNYTFSTYSGHPDGTWNNELGYGEVSVRSAVYLAQDFSTAPGLVVKDNSSDNGVEPTAYSTTFNSPSIVAKDATNSYEVDMVSYGSLYKVNVTVHNYETSSVIVDPSDVKLYYHTYATEQLTWPQSFPSGTYLTPSSTTPVTIAGNGGSYTFVITLDLSNIIPYDQTGTWYITFAAVIGNDPNEIHDYYGYNVPFDMFVEENRLVAGKTYINYEEPHIIIDPILPPHPGINATPNPTDGHTTIGIDIDELPQNATLVVTDMYGNVVVRELLRGASQEVNLGGRPAGNYYVFVVAGDKVIGMNKIVVY